MKEKIKIYSIAIAIMLVVYLLIRGIMIFFMNDYKETDYSAEQVSTILAEADSFKVEKNYKTFFKNDYNIIVNEEIIATVEGEYFKTFGDVFTLRSSNGELMMYECEEVFHLNNQAGVYNSNDEEIGRIESSYISFLYESHYFVNDTKIATCNEQFSIPREDTIKDSDGNLLYEISKTNVFASYYEYTVIDNSVISPEIAIFFGCINDVISNAEDD